MDYTMSLDDLVKRDKKLGRINKGGPKPIKGGKKPNKIQQQRNMVAFAKQGN